MTNDAQATPNTSAPSLAQELGLWDAVSLTMSIMIGSGIFLMAGSIAIQLDSVSAVAAVWAFGGLLSLCGAVALSELGAALPAAGGLYVYLTTVYGPAVGFVFGWSAMALIHAGSIATLSVAVGLLAAPVLGLGPVGQRLLPVALIAAFVGINCLGLKAGRLVQNTLTIAKLGGIAVMTAVLYWRGGLHQLTENFAAPATSLSWTTFAAALVAVLWAYDGWHFVAFAAGEVKNPSRTLPRSLLIGTTLTFVIYLLVNLAYYAVLPGAAIAGSSRVAATAIERVFGEGAAIFISLLVAVSILGTLNGLVFGAPRLNWAMANDGLFFRSFARLHPRFRTPVVATVAQGAWAAVFTLVGSFQQLFTSYVFISWIFYGLAVAGVLILRHRRPDLPRPYRCPFYPVTPLFFVIATVGIVLNTFVTGFWQAMGGVGLLLAGFPLYLLFRSLEGRRGRYEPARH